MSPEEMFGPAKRPAKAPIATGVLDYFPDALAAVAECSRIANEQHNPGQPMHWAREKSSDHANCLARHFLKRGTVDTDGVRHATKVAWRALALLQIELEGVASVAAFEKISDGAHVDAGDLGASYIDYYHGIEEDWEWNGAEKRWRRR